MTKIKQIKYFQDSEDQVKWIFMNSYKIKLGRNG